MIKIKPTIDQTNSCPYCLTALENKSLVWQGIHVCIKQYCPDCKNDLFSELIIGHANIDSFQVDPNNGRLFGTNSLARKIFGLPLLTTLVSPNLNDVQLQIKKYSSKKEVVIVNCLDYLYGHCLLKLFNVQRHLREKKDVIVIIPTFLEWMVPKEVSEIWCVDLKLSEMKKYYPKLEEKIENELKRFSTVYISRAFSHPNKIDIAIFTSVKPLDINIWDNLENSRVTFIWREDRPWFYSFPISYLARRLNLLSPLLILQNLKIKRLFANVKRKNPSIVCTVAGFGTSTTFPDWIEDKRVKLFTPTLEIEQCKIYAESKVVIGVHGSNMLLPSAHAGAVIDLLPSDRLGNYAQDIIYSSRITHNDPRLISFRYRFFSLSSSLTELSNHITNIVQKYPSAVKHFIHEYK